jgi:hypothetical protein
VPEHGAYENPYGPEEKRDVVSFDKMVGRDSGQIDPEADIEGDVLILHPDKIGKHLPEINFEKQLGRVEPTPIEEEELILDPNHDVIKPKVPTFDFGKQTGRLQPLDLD